MDPFYIEDLPRKQSVNASSSSSQMNPLDVTPTVPRKKFKNNEILSSFSSMKKIPDTTWRLRLDTIDHKIPIPLKRKRAREESDDEEETPNKKRKRTIPVATNSIAIQTNPEDDSILSFDGDGGSRDQGPTTSRRLNSRFIQKSSVLSHVSPSLVRSPLRCFTLEEHERADKKKEARVRKYLEAIRDAVCGPAPKFYEPPVTTATSSLGTISEATQPKVSPLPTSCETVPSAVLPNLQDVTKPATFTFGTNTSASTSTTVAPSQPFIFSAPISSSSVAATTTTAASTGSITSPIVQPPITASSSTANFNLKAEEATKPVVNFTSFGRADQPASDSLNSSSPIPGRKFAKGNRRLPQKVESSNPISTSGFAPFSFTPAVTTQAPSLGTATGSVAQTPAFNFSQPPALASVASNPPIFGSNPSAAFTFGQQNTQPAVSSTTQPFAFGAPTAQSHVFGGPSQNSGMVAPQAPLFGAPQGTTFNAQLPTNFDFGGGNVTASLSNLNSTAGSLFTPGTAGGVVKKTATRRSKYGRR